MELSELLTNTNMSLRY